MADAFTGEIRAFAWWWPPRDWASCDGKQQIIQQNTPLYVILGHSWGTPPNNSDTTFLLPDLRGKVMPGAQASKGAHGAGVSTYQIADKMGSSSVALAVEQITPHAGEHAFNAEWENPPFAEMTATPVATSFLSHPVKPAAGTVVASLPPAFSSDAANTTLSPYAIGYSSRTSAQPHDNRQPFQGLNFCICLYGEWPQRPN